MGNTGEIILEMRHITKEFSGVKALEDVAFSVRRGEVHALCGENGAGKSTLMNVLSGVYPVGEYSGDIVYEGNVCAFRNIRDSEGLGIVIIHQELALSPYMNIAENIFLGNEVTSARGVIDWNNTHIKAVKLLSKVGLEDENTETPVNALGVGKQQLIEIAKAMAKKVNLLILDEPTAALNDNESRKLLEIILGLKEHGVTCIIISHKLNEVTSIADSITILRDGKTIETLVKGRDEFSEERIIRGMVGRDMTSRFPPHERRVGDVIFEAKNWSVYHPDDPSREVVKNVSLTLRAGEVVGIAGLMGAGRTELAMSVFGQAYGSKVTGELFKDGRKLYLNSVKDAINEGIAYVSEDRKTYGLVLINDLCWNMTLASIGSSMFSRFGVLKRSEEVLKAEEYRSRVNIKCNSLEQSVGSLSGGNQQKVVLSKWMLSEPDVLILDEPTRGIDVGAKYEIYCIINDLAAQGKAVMFISSEMPELLGICDRIYVLNDGEIAGETKNIELTQEDIMKIIMDHNNRIKVA